MLRAIYSLWNLIRAGHLCCLMTLFIQLNKLVQYNIRVCGCWSVNESVSAPVSLLFCTTAESFISKCIYLIYQESFLCVCVFNILLFLLFIHFRHLLFGLGQVGHIPRSELWGNGPDFGFAQAPPSLLLSALSQTSRLSSSTSEWHTLSSCGYPRGHFFKR